MSKPTITRLFVGSLLAALAGGVLLIIAVSAALANDVFVLQGSEVVDVRPSALALVLLGVGLVGGLTILGAAIGGLISWIGALLNTAQLDSKAWFLALLLLGIFNFGFIAMIAYVLAGPDGRPSVTPSPSAAPVAA
jgi:hypothetical protein